MKIALHEDRRYGYDPADCPTGDDYCDNDQFNWTAAGCASCIDGYGVGVDCRGPDCNDNDDQCWSPGAACCPQLGVISDACTDVSECTGIINGTPQCLNGVVGGNNF